MDYRTLHRHVAAAEEGAGLGRPAAGGSDLRVALMRAAADGNDLRVPLRIVVGRTADGSKLSVVVLSAAVVCLAARGLETADGGTGGEPG